MSAAPFTTITNTQQVLGTCAAARPFSLQLASTGAADLPPELLYMICDELATNDLPEFRLVCRTWVAIGFEYLMPEVTIQPHVGSLTRLEAIADHPVLRHYVFDVIYEGNILPKYSYER